MSCVHKTLRSTAALVLVACLTLSACGGDSKKDKPSSKPTATSSINPEGLTLTKAGTVLKFGETATVEYSPSQTLGTVLALTVRSAAVGPLRDFKGFNLDPLRKKANYFYVKVTVENLGVGNLGGREVPIWGINAKDTLLQPVAFVSSFKQCPTKKLPKPFGKGAKLNTCLVFLSPDHGELTALAFTTSDSLDPIRWIGKITEPKQPTKKKG